MKSLENNVIRIGGVFSSARYLKCLYVMEKTNFDVSESNRMTIYSYFSPLDYSMANHAHDKYSLSQATKWSLILLCCFCWFDIG